MATYYEFALICARKSLIRHWRAYFTHPDRLTDAHVEQIVYLARIAARLARHAGKL